LRVDPETRLGDPSALAVINSAGLSATPFRTDEFRGITGPKK
jgi:hypothetical protein